jgi:hypothetical protein
MVAVSDPALKAQVRKLSAGDKGLANRYIEEAPAILLWIAAVASPLAATANLPPWSL